MQHRKPITKGEPDDARQPHVASEPEHFRKPGIVGEPCTTRQPRKTSEPKEIDKFIISRRAIHIETTKEVQRAKEGWKTTHPRRARRTVDNRADIASQGR